MGEIFERVQPQQVLEWTGERLTTAPTGQVEIEHLHRYFFARALCRGFDVLDVASGEGYGSALLAQVARSVVGIEVSETALAHSQEVYVAPNLRFQQGDARKLPLEDASIDVVVSFETLEHFFEHDLFIAEVQRVLRPAGFLILSSPERDVYSPLGSPANPYHVHELSRVEFQALLKRAFRNILILLQRPFLGSALIADDEAEISKTLTFERRGEKHYEVSHGLPRPPYNIAIASASELPCIPNSLFIETSEVGEILARAESNAAAHAELRSHMEQTEMLASGFRREIEVASETIKTQVERANKAEAALASPWAEVERLQSELAQTRAELALAGMQRDVLRKSFRGNANLLNKQAAEAKEWQQRYLGLRRRHEAILRYFWIPSVWQLLPVPLRAFIRHRVVTSGRKE